MSTIKVNAVRNTATNDGGIDIDASGHVQIDGQQLPTTGALSNRNLTINGAMNVAQRGTSSAYWRTLIVDRFAYIGNLGHQFIYEDPESLSSGFAKMDLKFVCVTQYISWKQQRITLGVFGTLH